ncbi:MAG: hypothetical protein FVQ80_00585 [Planctomycetes bacterium]|nr:hypothetical protein [Planctomycetota bacterium]
MDRTLEKKKIRTFGIGLAIIIFVAALHPLRRGHYIVALWLYIICATLICLSLFFPLVLKPVNKLFMAIAHCLGWVNTRILLSVLFFLILTPIALIYRLIAINSLDRKIKKNESTYWEHREKCSANVTIYERQF